MLRWIACSVALLTSCGDDSGETPRDAGTDSGALPDAGPDTGPPRPPDVCDELALARAPMRPATGTRFGDVAGDFTATLADGTEWTLSEHWSGCESYVFFVHFPGTTDALYRTAPDPLFTEGPRNVRYFFLSDASSPESRAASATNMAAALEEGFAFWELSEEERAFWRSRFHFVSDRATEVEGSVGDHLRDYLAWARTPEATVDLGDRGRAPAPAPVVFAIDRGQAWDGGVNLSPAVGMPPRIGMAAYLGHFYEYRAALDARLEGETATEVTLIDERTTLRTVEREVSLPPAAEMATFDTMEIDIEIDCEHMNPFACSEWDRIADVQLCTGTDAGMPCTERLEIARWITPYWRPGRQRYLIDASPFLALLREGGPRSFFVELGPDWERPTEWVARVALRLRTRGGEPRATGAVLAYRGGTFDASYATRPPFAFTPPASATRVELVTILSGHGQDMATGCAEWCDHRHAFALNGTALPVIAHTMPAIGSDRGCASRSGEGIIPGQWGNWAQARAYWCPGLPVVARRDDVTAAIRAGENTLEYTATFGTGAPRGGDIALSAYLVWYE